MRMHVIRTAAALVFLGGLVGCSQETLVTGTSLEDEAPYETSETDDLDEDRQPRRFLGVGPGLDWLSQVDLSDEQIAAIQDIAKEFRPTEAEKTAEEAAFTAVTALLEAETLDVDALRTALSEATVAPKAPTPGLTPSRISANAEWVPMRAAHPL